MPKRNIHQSSPPQPIRLYSWRQRLADSLSASFYPVVCVVAVIVVLLDVFVWRP
jgi:hypothetical protein